MDLFDDLKVALHDNRDPLRAIPMKSYMKHNFEYFGIKSPIRKKLVSQAWRENKIKNYPDLKSFTIKCWKETEREWQYVAMDVMGKSKKLYNENTILLAEYLIATKSWWDTVDWLAAHPVGYCFEHYPHQKDQFISKWMASGNIWLQRTCLIFQLSYKEKTDFKLMKKLIIELKGSKEFFINKAAGWALRQYSKYNPLHVKEFILQNPDLHSITKKEGLKYC